MQDFSPRLAAAGASMAAALLVTVVQGGNCRVAAATALRVTALHVTRPPILGQYATVTCVIRNTGPRSEPLGQIVFRTTPPLRNSEERGLGPDNGPGAGARGSMGFTVAPPDETPPTSLRPGQTITIRRFGKMNSVGQFSCAVSVRPSHGAAIALTFVDGRPASRAFEVIPAASAPDVRFLVNDPNARHVYRPGDTIRVQVTPFVSGGPDLSAAVESLAMAPGDKPFAMTDASRGRAILLEHQHSGAEGFVADFWSVDPSKRFLDLVVQFKKPVAISSFSLSGENLNDQYGLKNCTAHGIRPDGGMTRLPVISMTEQSRWTIMSAMPQSMPMAGLRLRLATAYKLNITDLALHGTSVSAQPAAGGPMMSCRWQDAVGKPLSQTIRLTPFKKSAITSPRGLQPGYYGLVMTTHIAGMDDLRHEFGFVVLPKAEPGGIIAPDTDPRFGMVHMDLNDPNLGMGGVKTLGMAFYDSEHQTLDRSAWQSAMKERRARGLTELPLVSGGEWASDSDRPVSADQLRRLKTMMRQYFAADPAIPAWELGIEENLGYRGRRSAVPSYWSNLEAKALAVREAAEAAGVKVKLVYQIAELDPDSVEDFCRSSASRQFDVLSLHPYAWPDFPPPEKWLPAYLHHVRALMARYHATKPVWFTEIGAPVDGDPGGFFGYPSNGVDDRGLTRREYADYMVKCNLLALQSGVQKIFWYNYRDRGSDPQFAEDHFGLVDFRGYPKPAYAAYATMTRTLHGSSFGSSKKSHGPIRALGFESEGQEKLVLWTYPATFKKVSLQRLGIAPGRVLDSSDLWGRPISIQTGTIALSNDPVYLRLRALKRPSKLSNPKTSKR